MTVLRAGLALVAAIGALYAVAAFAVWHDPAVLPVAGCAALACAIALLERGRYREHGASLGHAARPTGETFFDPVTGAPTRVYYDAETGMRHYR